MKNIHYLNIGMPKTGSTSVFDTLTQHPVFSDQDIAKENLGFSHFGWPIQKYKAYYQHTNSLDFNVGAWEMSSDQLILLNDYVTHSSIILRKPIEFIKSLYNFLDQQEIHTPESFIDMMIENNQLDYAKIIKHWTSNITSPFLILFYEDLVLDHKMFYDSITKFLGIESYSFIPSKKNITKYITPSVTPTINQTKKINSMIANLETYLQKSLTHWKL